MPKTKILFAVAKRREHDEFTFTPDIIARLEAMGEMLRRPDLNQGTQEEYGKVLTEFQPEVVITAWNSPTVTMREYRRCPALKFMNHAMGGIRGVVTKEVVEAGVIVANWGNLSAYSVAEECLMLTLACLRRASWYMREIEQGGFRTQKIHGVGLAGKRVGLHGLGGIAQEYVRLLQPFQCQISAYSPHAPDEVFAQLGIRRETSLEKLYAENDVVSVHASKTKANHRLVDARILGLMQKNAVLINTARGAVIDTEALVAKLKEGKIWAGLDVYDPEPPEPDSPLRTMRNCLMMPHVGGPTWDRLRLCGEHVIENLRRYQAGEPLLDVVPANKYDLMT